MTKKQALRELSRRGWTDFVADGRFAVWATAPNGQRGLFDPRDLLAELDARAEVH